MDHSTQSGSKNHTTLKFAYADATAREADGPFLVTDKGSIAFQQDNSSFWILNNTTGGASAWTSIGGSAFSNNSVDISIHDAGNVVIDTRPAVPSGINRWKLVSIDLRVKTALGGGTVPTASLSIGSAPGGSQIVAEQVIDSSTPVGTIVGGFSLSSLGAGMSQSTGFEAMYPASQAIYAGVTLTGAPTSGVVTAYLVWQGLQ